MTSLKRECVKDGPYRKVSLFEAANRIMTDLILLYGIRHLLSRTDLPYTDYEVQYGTQNDRSHDIEAQAKGLRLSGEAFNVAQSFFNQKRRASMKKLRAKAHDATHRILLFNADALRHQKVLDKRYANESYYVVNLGRGKRVLQLPARVLLP